jgi:hypothetical protein
MQQREPAMEKQYIYIYIQGASYGNAAFLRNFQPLDMSLVFRSKIEERASKYI